jgi:hypothetical protein
MAKSSLEELSRAVSKSTGTWSVRWGPLAQTFCQPRRSREATKYPSISTFMDVLRRLRGAVVDDCIEGTNVDVDIVKCESDARQIGRGGC